MRFLCSARIDSKALSLVSQIETLEHYSCENVVVDDDVIGLLITADLGHHIGLNFLFGFFERSSSPTVKSVSDYAYAAEGIGLGQRTRSLETAAADGVVEIMLRCRLRRRRMATLSESANDAYAGE
nr:hypothetical protein Iba_chr14eCG5360 [Ipomoea batatas]